MTRFAPRTIKRFLTLPADFKRHDFVANFFIENQSLKWNLWKRKNQILKQTFSGTMKIWKENFPKGQVLNWEFFVPANFEYKTFRIIIFWRRNIFQKLSFWVQFLLRNPISIKNSHLKKNVLTQFTPQKTTNFPHFVLLLKGMILKQAFSLKIRVWNGIFGKKFEFWKEVFSYKLKSFWIKSFSSWRISKKFFQYSFCGERIIFEI